MHHRNRAARLAAQQQISEAFENEVEPAVVRLKAPLITRPQREFIPSADSAFDFITADGEMQLELPFSPPDEEKNLAQTRPTQRHGCNENPAGSALITTPTQSDRDPTERTAGRSDEFTIGGILYGCLLGSAAAALILVCLRALFP